MEGEEFLASRHREVVTEFIDAVLGGWGLRHGPGGTEYPGGGAPGRG